MTMQSMMKMPMSMPVNMPGMPMQAMLPMMMASMKMTMSAGKAQCDFEPAQGMDQAAFQQSCDMMQLMVTAGMPLVMQAGNMAMMCMRPAPGMAMPMMLPTMSVIPSALCTIHMDVGSGTMRCDMMPGQGMDSAMFDAACQLMDKMMQMGLPMMMMCNGSPVMCCTV